IEVLNSVLPFAIFGHVEILHNLGTGRYRSLEVRIDIVNEDGQALSPRAELRGYRTPRPRAFEHDPGAAEIHLRALGRIAVAVVLSKSEGFRQPCDRIGDVSIDNVR